MNLIVDNGGQVLVEDFLLLVRTARNRW